MLAVHELLPYMQGRAVLEAIRGTVDVDAEYGTIVYAHRREKAAGDNQWKTMATRNLRPHLVMSIALPFFQQVLLLRAPLLEPLWQAGFLFSIGGPHIGKQVCRGCKVRIWCCVNGYC